MQCSWWTLNKSVWKNAQAGKNRRLDSFFSSSLNVNVLRMMKGEKKNSKSLDAPPKICFQVERLFHPSALFNFIHEWTKELGASDLTYSHSKVYLVFHLFKWFFNVKPSVQLPNSANYFLNSNESMSQIKCLFLSYSN